MDFLEQDLETIIHDARQSDLYNRGLDCIRYDAMYRQVPLLDYGRADLITVDILPWPDHPKYRRGVHISIFELKQNKIDMNTLLQASGYLRAAKDIVAHLAGCHNLKNTCFTYSIVLIGKTIETGGNFCLLADSIPFVNLYTYTYALDGLRFSRRSGYRITDCNLSGKAAEYSNDWKERLSVDRYLARIPPETEEERANSPF